MDFEIRPEPSSTEYDALSRALERLLGSETSHPAYRSRWRDRGVRENTGDEDEAEELYATARPRSKPGASRA